jgi:hypothetical protein
MSEHDGSDTGLSPNVTARRAVRMRLLGAVVALGAGVAAIVIAVMLVRGALA